MSSWGHTDWKSGGDWNRPIEHCERCPLSRIGVDLCHGRHGREAGIGPGTAKVADGLALAAAGPRVEGPRPFEDGCMTWGAAAEA